MTTYAKTEYCQSTLHKHLLFDDYQDFMAICSKLKYIGIDHFIFIRRFQDGSFINLATHIKWASFFLTKYLAGKYEDKYMKDHMFINTGVSLWKMNKNNIVWQEGDKFFGYDNGISIAIDHNDYTDMFCYYKRTDSLKSDDEKNHYYLSRLDYLYKFNEFFLFKAHSIIKSASKQRLITPEKYLTSCIVSKSDSPSQKLLGNLIGTENHILKSHERVCVDLYEQGLSSKEISEQLYISPRTVETRLNVLKNRFNCKNLYQFIALKNRYQL